MLQRAWPVLFLKCKGSALRCYAELRDEDYSMCGVVAGSAQNPRAL